MYTYITGNKRQTAQVSHRCIHLTYCSKSSQNTQIHTYIFKTYIPPISKWFLSLPRGAGTGHKRHDACVYEALWPSVMCES